MAIKRIGIMTGGGDCPGLNAVIRAAVLSAHARGWEVLESRPGFYDESLAPFALRPRDRSVVGWLLRLLQLPGGSWLLRAWHTRRR